MHFFSFFWFSSSYSLNLSSFFKIRIFLIKLYWLSSFSVKINIFSLFLSTNWSWLSLFYFRRYSFLFLSFLSMFASTSISSLSLFTLTFISSLFRISMISVMFFMFFLRIRSGSWMLSFMFFIPFRIITAWTPKFSKMSNELHRNVLLT